MSALSSERNIGALERPAVGAKFDARGEPLRRKRSLGLAGRLLLLTIGFVLIAITLFYVMRLSAFRETWLRGRLVAAQTAVVAFDATGGQELSSDLTRKILESVGAKSISVGISPHRRLLARSDTEPRVDVVEDLADPSAIESVTMAFKTLFADPRSVIRIRGGARGDDSGIEIALDQEPLIEAMWRVSQNFLILALTVSAVVTLVLWAALWHMVIRPVRRLTSSIIAFGANPQETPWLGAGSDRDDDIGRAETALAAMQRSLANELSQRKRLAELGMAVARINHDLRNMLAAAQLISDRLAAIPDPLAQRLAPRLVATLDRAISFCQATLAYGAARERAPTRRCFDLREVVRQIVETAEASNGGAIAYTIDIPPKFEIDADPDHIQRAIENLSRNAAQALQNQGPTGERPHAIRFAAIRTTGAALIEISDTGPGLPEEIAAHIFEPFHASTREGGSGLGLAIAADLVSRNGGSISLAPAQREDFYRGARFLITLPTPEARGHRRSAQRIA